MKLTWVPPPGWPPPPYRGWAPAPGWQPDPGWPPPPADWQYWQPTPSRPIGTRAKAGAAACVVGAVTAIVGAFGSWITVSSRFTHNTLHSGGFQAGHDGPFVLALSLVALGIVVPKLFGVRTPIWLDVVAVVAALVLVLICIADTADVHNRVTELRIIDAGLTGSVGVGLKLALVGSIVAAIGAATAIEIRRT